MKIFTIHRIPWQIFACHILLYLTIHFVSESEAKLGHAGWAKSDSRTKQILQNIRSRIAAQQAEEQQQQEKCDPKLPTCVLPHSKEVEDDSAEKTPPVEVIPPLRFRARHKTAAQLKKDIGHAVALKDRRSATKKGDKDEDAHKKPKKDDEDKVRVKPIQKKVNEDVGSSEEKKKELKKVSSEVPKAPHHQLMEPSKPKLDIIRKPQKKVEEKIDMKTSKREDRKSKEPKTESVKLKAAKQEKKQKPDMLVKREKRSEKKREEKNQRFPDDVPVFSLTSDSVQSQQCKKHSRVYVRQLQRYKMWALMMYDATAKLPSGILQGNTNQYGDFDQCLSVNATFKKRDKDGIEGKYCLATIDISTDSTDPGLRHAIHRSQSFNFVKSKISDPGHFIPRFSTVNWGLCIPSVCKAEDLENSIKSSLVGYKKSSGLIFDVKVEEKNCVTKRDLLSDYDVKTFITLLFYVSVIAITMYATLKDKNGESSKKKLRPASEHNTNDSEIVADEYPSVEDDPESRKTSHGKLKAFIKAFSLKRNLKKLFIEGESEDSIYCIHGIKSIFTVMLYFAHKTIPLALTPFSNRVVLTEISNEVSSVLLRGSIIYTDSFLLISGVLTSFNLCKDLKRNGRILWIQRTISRFIRLTPALFATLLFYAYISNYLGSGPIWNIIVKENAILCQKFMWRNLFYIQNFYQFEEMCAPQTHQLALDMQLFLLSPALVYALHEYDKIGIGILQALVMSSAILRFMSTSNNELSLVIYHGMPISQLYKTANLVYIQTIHRSTPYIIGVIVGFYLQKAGKTFQFPSAVVVVGWISCVCLALSSLIAPAGMVKRDYEYDAAQAAHYAVFSPIAWSLALGWFIAACHLGYGGKLNKYLSCRTFIVFSRISYSVYLIQFLVFSHKAGTKRIPEMFSVVGSVDIMEFITIVIISIGMTLLFDIPAVEIKTIVLSLLPDKKKEPILEVKETSQGYEKEEQEKTESTQQLEKETIVPAFQTEEIVEVRHELDKEIEDKKIMEENIEYEEEGGGGGGDDEEGENPEDLDYDQLEDEYDGEEDEDIDIWRRD